MTAVDRRLGVFGAAAVKVPCRVVTTTNIALDGLKTIDGVALSAGDRVLVNAQSDTKENGIYVADTGEWPRAQDFNGPRDFVQGTQVLVTSGTKNARTIWELTTASPAVGSALAFSLLVVSPMDNVMLGPRWFGGVGDGIANDRTAIQAAIDYQAARGGGRVDLSYGKWLIDGDHLYLKRNVSLYGPWLMPGTGTGSLRIDISGFRSVLLLTPGCEVRAEGDADSAGLEGLCILNVDVFNDPTPTTLRENLDRRNLFAGTAVRIGAVAGPGFDADDFCIRNCFIGGFEYGTYSSYVSRPRIDHVAGDNLNGIYITKCYDMDYISNVHFWPFLTPSGGPTAYKAYSVVGVTNNGSGLCRVEVSEDHILETGDTDIVINGVGGATGVNGTHGTVTRIDARHFDCVGSTFGGVYTSGGTVHVLVFKRHGIGIHCDTDTDWAQLSTCFCYGYQIAGIKISNSDHAKLMNCGADNFGTVNDQTTRGIWIDGDCSATSLIGCKAAAQGYNFDINVTPTWGATVSMLGCDSWGARLYGIRANAGHVDAVGTHFQEFNTLRVESAGSMTISGGDLTSVAFSYATGAKRVELRGPKGTAIRDDIVSSGTSGIRLTKRTTAYNSSPAANDGIAETVEVTDSAVTPVEIFKQTVRANVVTAGSVSSQVFWSLRSSGTYADRLLLTPTSLAPAVNGGLALGTPALGWSGVCFSANTALNWGNGTYTITQGGSNVTFSGSAAFGTYVKTATYTVGTLPAAATAGAGAIAAVTDANAPTYLATVAGGGSTFAAVRSDGANWKCA